MKRQRKGSTRSERVTGHEVGAVAGGAAGAALGSFAGPVGAAVGAAVGAIAGGLGGGRIDAPKGGLSRLRTPGKKTPARTASQAPQRSAGRSASSRGKRGSAKPNRGAARKKPTRR